MTAPPGAGIAARLLGLGDDPLVLASASPRRAELLRALGIPFRRRPVDVNERLHDGEDPPAAAVRLAEAKARAAADGEETGVVLAADTLVVHRGAALGKPRDDDEVRSMLRSLSGAEHTVVTGVAVARASTGRLVSGARATRVRFAPIDGDDLETLVRSGEGRDKAGAYGIQGLAGLLIEGIDGDYFNVVGLPLELVRRLLHRLQSLEETS